MKKIMQWNMLALFLLLNSVSTIAQTLPRFDKIMVTGNVSILLIAGEEEKMDVQKNANELEYEVEGQTLKLLSKNLIQYNKASTIKKLLSKNLIKYKKTSTIKIAITYRQLRDIKARAGASVYSDTPLAAEALQLRFSSGASGELTITAKSLEASVSEGGTLTLQGITDFLEAKAITGGTLSAYDLDSQSTIVKTNTGGSAKVVAHEEIDATAKTGGSIIYKGNPKKARTKDGLSGSIKEY